MKSYKTALGDAVFTQSILKSKFIGYLRHIETEEEATEFINEIRKKHRDATHNCYGYFIRKTNTGRYSDDGEPSGTAGLPIYDVIKGEGLYDVAIVVTRYFGGTLLGTGGLVRAYGSSAKGAIECANTVTMEETRVFRLELDYKFLDRLNSFIEKNSDVKQTKTTYGEKIEMNLQARNRGEDGLKAYITDITGNNFAMELVGEDYLPW